MGQRDVIGFSGGASPKGKVDHFTLDVLVTAGVEIGAYRNKGWDQFLRPIRRRCAWRSTWRTAKSTS